MKILTFICCACTLTFSFAAFANDEYTRCLDSNYQTSTGLAKCANEETNRIMAELEKRYGVVAGHKYFLPWNNTLHNFADLKTAWIKYRDDYCNLLGYSELHAQNDYGHVSEARCRLRETLKFREDIENLVKNYQKTLVPTKL